MQKQYRNIHTGYVATQLTGTMKDQYGVADKDGTHLINKHKVDIEGNPLIWEMVPVKQETQSLKLADLKGKKVAIHCQNQDEWVKCISISGSRVYKEYFTTYIDNSCLGLDNTNSWCDLKWFQSDDYTIIPASDLIAANTTPDWEILEFKGSAFTYSKKVNGNYSAIECSEYPYESFLQGTDSLEDGRFSIHCVRYKGNEYRVGGKVYFSGNIETISAFKIMYDKWIMVTSESDKPSSHNIDVDLRPYTPPAFLLRTEDGVEVTDPEQTVYCLSKTTLAITGTCTASGQAHWIDKDLCFSTEAARTEYINRNSKTMSVADLERWDKEYMNSGEDAMDKCYVIPHSKVQTHINGQQS